MEFSIPYDRVITDKIRLMTRKKGFYDGLDRFLVQDLNPNSLQVIEGFIDSLCRKPI